MIWRKFFPLRVNFYNFRSVCHKYVPIQISQRYQYQFFQIRKTFRIPNVCVYWRRKGRMDKMHTVSLVLFFNSWKTFFRQICSVSQIRRAKLLDFDFSDSFEDSDSAIYQTSNCCLKKIFILCSSRQQGHHNRLESFFYQKFDKRPSSLHITTNSSRYIF